MYHIFYNVFVTLIKVKKVVDFGQIVLVPYIYIMGHT